MVLTRAAAGGWLPFVLPMAVFLVLTAVEGSAPNSCYPLLYSAKVTLVAAALWWAWPACKGQFAGTRRGLWWGTVAGGIGYVVWIGLDRVTPHWDVLGTRVGFNPFVEIANSQVRSAFIAVRLLGMVVLVPLMEELFWRSFLLRYLSDADRWEQLSLRECSWRAGCVTTALFGLSHPEWLAALAFGAGMLVLVRITNNLAACTIAHGLTNLCLAIHILFTGAWVYW